MLASVYVVVTSNAAIGTDQNGATFWEKIRVSFLQRGGNAGRNECSLQNRFNKVLQMEVNKYIGMLMSVLREYHSGWVLEDYVNDAKRKFLVKFGKRFKLKMVYNVLKKSGLPKDEISMAAIDSRVRRALFFCDNDNEVSVVDDGEGGDVMSRKLGLSSHTMSMVFKMVLQGQSMAHNMSITLKCVESMFKRLESN
jgi:hypothetical protein